MYQYRFNNSSHSITRVLVFIYLINSKIQKKQIRCLEKHLLYINTLLLIFVQQTILK